MEFIIQLRKRQLRVYEQVGQAQSADIQMAFPSTVKRLIARLSGFKSWDIGGGGAVMEDAEPSEKVICGSVRVVRDARALSGRFESELALAMLIRPEHN